VKAVRTRKRFKVLAYLECSLSFRLLHISLERVLGMVRETGAKVEKMALADSRNNR
jgi:hypothetical protein